MVMLAVAWPSCFCTALTLAPSRIISEAAVCRRSYSRRSSGSAAGWPCPSSWAMASLAARTAGLKLARHELRLPQRPTTRRGNTKSDGPCGLSARAVRPAGQSQEGAP
jgi:hypothetical protein